VGHPILERIVTIRGVHAIRIAGHRIAAQMEGNATTTRFDGITTIPALGAINVTANVCIIVVQFMLMVIPVGSTKLVISLLHPSSSKQVLVLRGSVAAEELVENPNTPTFAIFLKNFIGFSLVVSQIPIG